MSALDASQGVRCSEEKRAVDRSDGAFRISRRERDGVVTFYGHGDRARRAMVWQLHVDRMSDRVHMLDFLDALMHIDEAEQHANAVVFAFLTVLEAHVHKNHNTIAYMRLMRVLRRHRVPHERLLDGPHWRWGLVATGTERLY